MCKSIIRRALIGLVATVGLVGSAWGQVATPPINPTAASVLTINPASIQWSTPSRVSAAYVDGVNQNYTAGALTSEATINGAAGQAVIVEDSISFGVEYQKYAIGSATPLTVSEGHTALAFQAGDSLALGIGHSFIRRTDTGQVDTSPIWGASFKVGESFFLGLSKASEQRERGGATSIRGTTRYGAGFRTASKGGAVRMEYFRIISDPHSFLGVPEEELNDDTLVFEWLSGSMLIGFRYREITQTDNAVVTEKLRRGWTLGYVPMKGWAVVASIDNRDWQTLATTNTQQRSRNRIGIAYQF